MHQQLWRLLAHVSLSRGTSCCVLQWGNGVLEGALGVYLTERLDAARSLSRLFALQLYHQLEVGMRDEADGRCCCSKDCQQLMSVRPMLFHHVLLCLTTAAACTAQVKEPLRMG